MTISVFKLFAQVELSICIPRSSCKVEQSPGLYMVLRDTKTYSDASSQRVLAKAAARCSAIPCKRKPFLFIFGDTSANNVAAAECALAVRAAQGRPSCSQLERPLMIPGHALSAVKQHVRQERVRRRVLQQRRLPPALGRVAEAPLLAHSLPLLEQTVCQMLRHEEMAPRHNACRVMLRVPDAARASKEHQPEH
jgi:hypothetical protein